jgi:hypothetical protein
VSSLQVFVHTCPCSALKQDHLVPRGPARQRLSGAAYRSRSQEASCWAHQQGLANGGTNLYGGGGSAGVNQAPTAARSLSDGSHPPHSCNCLSPWLVVR